MSRQPDSPAPPRPGDRRVLAAGTAQNLVGIAVAGVALLVVQTLTSRVLGPEGYGQVTLLTQAAFVASFATRAGMDMAVLRDVAIEIGRGRSDLVRAAVARAVAIAAGVSCVAAAAAALAHRQVAGLLSLPGDSAPAVVAAAAGLPAIAATNVWLNATRGLKIMRYTLLIFFAGQNLAWIVLSLLAWQVSETPTASVAAYSASWVLAAAASAWAWRREAGAWAASPPEPGWLGRLLRYAGPRAPAALLAQLLFWTDLFVVAHYVTGREVGVYSAALRAGQILLLFLTSVNLIFAPFVADLHARGERERLDELFKTLTRWVVAGTLPALLLIALAPEGVLALFGEEFTSGRTALLVLLVGQFLNAATGSGGLVLIMIGRTGYDLAVYAGSLALSLGLALLLAPRFGITGAAVANAVMFAASNAARLLLVRRFAGIQPYDRRYLALLRPALAGALAMGAVTVAVPAPPLAEAVLAGLLGGAAYLAALLAWGLSPDERAALARLGLKWAR